MLMFANRPWDQEDYNKYMYFLSLAVAFGREQTL